MRPLALALVLLTARAAAASCSDDLTAAAGVPVTAADDVEPEVCKAFLATIQRMPPPHRRKLAKLRVVRAHDLGIPADAPLIYRMMSAGTLAFFDVGHHRLVVTDAGAADRPGWTAGKVAPADVKTLLDELGLSWDELARRAGLATVPEVGDPAVIDGLIRLTVRRLLPDVPLPALLAHEMGHLVQLGENGSSSSVAGWSTLSGWREREHDEPADGFIGGGYQDEHPIVAVRLALGLDRGPEARYAPGADGHFITDYARFSPMEDFAEAYRHLLFDPDKLAAAPEKWVAAAGFETEATPLPVPPDALEAGARRLLGYSPGPPIDAFFALEVLRGRGAALEPLARKLGGKLPRWPADVPAESIPVLRKLGVRAGRATLLPEPRALLAAAAGAVDATEDLREFDRGLDHKLKNARDPYERLLLAEEQGRKLIAAGDLAAARRAAGAIRGQAVGARARATLFAELCKAHGARNETAAAAAAAGAARAARAEVFFPSWRDKLVDCAK